MKKLIIEPHYFGCLEYFCLVQHCDEVLFEVMDSFSKQTYRNRTYILGSNKVLPMIVPLSYSNKTPTKDVKIDYSQRWIKDHWGALYSAYGNAPFFDFFAEDFKGIWDSRPEFLLDLNMQLMTRCCKLIGKKIKWSFTDLFQANYPVSYSDFRNTIQPKNAFSDRNIYRTSPYYQLFGDWFVPNLSIVDLIMCEGPHSSEVLSMSYRG